MLYRYPSLVLSRYVAGRGRSDLVTAPDCPWGLGALVAVLPTPRLQSFIVALSRQSPGESSVSMNSDKTGTQVSFKSEPGSPSQSFANQEREIHRKLAT